MFVALRSRLRRLIDQRCRAVRDFPSLFLQGPLGPKWIFCSTLELFLGFQSSQRLLLARCVLYSCPINDGLGISYIV